MTIGGEEVWMGIKNVGAHRLVSPRIFLGIEVGKLLGKYK
jgi:hypothetical protein